MTDLHLWLLSGSILLAGLVFIGALVDRGDLPWFILTTFIVIAAMVLAVILT